MQRDSLSASGPGSSGACDVLIVGAGPAGLAAALNLAEEGYSVSVVEQQPCVGSIIACAEGVNRFIGEDTNLGVDRYISQEVGGASVHVGDGRSEIPSGFFGGAVIEKRRFLQDLSRKACELGAAILTTHRLLGITTTPDGVDARVYDGSCVVEQPARLVIGADGVVSSVARELLGAAYRPLDVSRCVQITVSGSSVPLPESRRFHFFFSPENPAGYGWMFPKSQTSANIGVGSFDPTVRLRPLLESLIRGSRLLDRVVGKAQESILAGGLVPVSGARPPEELVHAAGLLAGSAAGIVEAITGEGIAPALSSGIAAAQAAMLTLRDGNSQRPNLALYDTLWRNSSYLGSHKLGEVLDLTVASLPGFYQRVARALRGRKPAKAIGRLIYRANKAI